MQTRLAMLAMGMTGLGLLVSLAAVIPGMLMAEKAERTDVMVEESSRHLTWMAVTALMIAMTTVPLAAMAWPLQDLVERFWTGRLGVVLGCMTVAGLAASWAFVRWRAADPAARSALRRVVTWTMVVGGVITPLALAGALAAAGSVPAAWVERTAQYFALVMSSPQTVAEAHLTWFRTSIAQTLLPPMPFVATTALALLLLTTSLVQCPYQNRRTLHGNARLATMADLRRWRRPRPSWFSADRKTVDLLGKRGVILGRYQGRYVRQDATLSTLVLARPGAGKTAGIAMPTILADGMETWSLFIFDIKGELYEDTAGHRAKFGPVFRFEPKGRTGARFNILSPTKSLPDGPRYFQAKGEMMQILGRTFGAGEGAETARIKLMSIMDDRADWKEFVRAAPMELAASPAEATGLPAMEPHDVERVLELATDIRAILGDWETHLSRVANALLPDNPQAGPNKHFDDTGREAMLGMMGFTIFRCERLGIEPSMGRVVDAWTDAAGNKEPGGEEGDETTEAIERMLWEWIEECDAYGYPKRYKQALITLVTKAPNERASVISTADRSFNVFKMATVKERTSTSDFAIDDLRGIKGSDGVSRPMTLYIVVSLEDIKTFAPILMMLTEAANNRLISQPAKQAKKARPVLFLLDEFAQIPKMQCLLSGPAVGRGMKVASLLIAQSYGQIEENYGKAGVTTLKDTTEFAVIFPLKDKTTADDVSGTIGKTTIKTRSTGGPENLFTSLFSPQGQNRTANENYQGAPLFEASDLMTEGDEAKMRPGQQLVLVGGRANRPLMVETPYYFKEATLLKRSQISAPSADEARGYCGPLAHLSPRHALGKEETPPASAGADGSTGPATTAEAASEAAGERLKATMYGQQTAASA